MDYARLTKTEIMSNLKELCGESCVDFSTDDIYTRNEEIAVNDDTVLEHFLETNTITHDEIRSLVSQGKVCPCFFGSGLKTDGVEEFLEGLSEYVVDKPYPLSFGAKVFKISHDSKGEKLTHIKITGGKLKVKDTVTYNGTTEKINNIRKYYGTKFESVDEVSAGDICVVTGLSAIKCGDGIGFEETSKEVFLEPVMNYRIVLPSGVDAQTFIPKIKNLEEEDPQLKVSWNSFLQEINVALMGEVQTEILKSLIKHLHYDDHIDKYLIFIKF
jgi:translation elongation factor EF-G